MSRPIVLAAVFVALCPFVRAEENGSPASGWRGNWTGLYPDAHAPTEWANVSTGPVQTMKCSAQPADETDKGAVPIEKGLITRWLVIGPFRLADASKEFAKELIPGEATLAPREGDKVGDLAWRPAEATSDGVSFYSVKAFGGRGGRNLAGYAHTCLYAQTAGRVRAVFEHVVGLTMYLNGKQVYSDPEQRMVMGSAYGQSRNRIASIHPIAPSAEFEVHKGWNRLTIKLVAPNRSQWNDLAFFLRVMDVADAPYARKNILWLTPLPDRSNASPIIVGDKVFVAAEPDELICIDKNSGKVLWNALNTYFDAIPQAEREANPVFKEKLEPLARQAKDETNPAKRAEFRKKLQDSLAELDKKKYARDFDGHLASHFEIVGTSTTPCSDGKRVYVWTGAGVAACYDLDGNRQWIRRLHDKLFYSASPALIGGKLAVFLRKLYGLDAKTGEVVWTQPKVNKTVAALLAARIAGTDVFISQQGEVVRAADGQMLWASPAKATQDTGWCAPVVSGDVLYLPWFGISRVYAIYFSGCAGDAWTPKVETIDGITAGVPREKGDQGDPWMAASPLIHDGLLYAIDIHSRYYVVDLKTRKRLAWRNLELPGDFNYVAFRVAASPTLVGKFIVVMDNQGHAVTLEPGAACKEIARNLLATQLQRDWPITPIEYTSYSPPVPDGGRLYLRGERHLYCIGLP